LSAIVLLAVSALAVAGCVVTGQVVADQEHKLLKQRTEEAALYLSSIFSSVQTELASLAASAAATDKDPASFEKGARLLTSVPGGFTAVALISTSTPPSVIAASGAGLQQGLGATRTAAVTGAVAKIGLTGSLVATPLFGGSKGSRSLGFAYASPTLPDAVIYAESKIQPSTPTATTASQPFSELIAAVYATDRQVSDQLVAATGSTKDLPHGAGSVAVKAAIGQGRPWLLVAKARHPLVGSVASVTPWAILGAGLLAALLATGIVETLARRREYALGLVAIRTEELETSMSELATAHEQLVRQERLAAIGELASTIGHELRNPLGVLSNAVYLLRNDLGEAPTDAAQRHLATADREISAATVIVADLLEFARQRQPVVDDIDATALVEEILSILPPPTGITVTREGAGPVFVPADRDMVRQVLLNIVGNGYQAMPDGGSLAVAVDALDGAVQIRVKDTGVGISAETRERLFEPFFTTKARGVGLGLAVSRRIIEAHGGEIVVDSEVGRGTEFRIVLPAIAAPRTATPSDASERVAP
jgi:signal transduction histidine kinase